MEKFFQNDDAFFEPADALGVFDAHDFVFQRLRRTLLVRSAEANGQPRTAARNDVQARPLLRQQRRVAMRKRSHTADGELHFFSNRRKRRKERDGLQARFGEQAVTDPNGAESAGVFAAFRHVEKFRNRHRADNHAAIG